MIYFNLFIKIQKGLIFGQDFVKDSISLKNLLKKKMSEKFCWKITYY